MNKFKLQTQRHTRLRQGFLVAIICASSAGFLQTWPEFFGGRANFIGKVAGKLKAARDEGVDTIVDVTPADVGRDIRLIKEVSRLPREDRHRRHQSSEADV